VETFTTAVIVWEGIVAIGIDVLSPSVVLGNRSGISRSYAIFIKLFIHLSNQLCGLSVKHNMRSIHMGRAKRAVS
jgi:hypothetical protein